MSEKKPSEVVPATPQALAPVPGTPAWIQEFLEQDAWTSLDLKKPEQNDLFMFHRQATDGRIRDAVNQEIAIVHILAHPAQKMDVATGELLDLVRVVLIDADGVGWQAFSKGIRSSVKALFQSRGLPPYDPPVKVVVQQVQSGNGFQMLQFVPPSLCRNGKAKKK